MTRGVNIQFEQLSFKVKCGTFKKTEKTVLENINGTFRECELSVIMGPSGSGKSTLLNILTGLETENVSGSIQFNGSSQNFKSIRNQSAYIMQDQNLYPLLNVRESMSFAIKFKTGKLINQAQQRQKCDQILNQLGLSESHETFVKNLSGGQQKRLSIAIELVNDPLVLFLDEPTTGLDSSSSTQCISLLKRLTEEGKTIIATIHTPSALMLEKFDHLYVLAEGSCIYQGTSRNVVPFLTELDLICPESYNPADYLLEISTNDYGVHNVNLTEKIQNGLNDDYRLQTKTEILTNGCQVVECATEKYSASFSYQLYLLIQRNFLLMRRDKSLMAVRLIVSFIMALLVGVLFFNIGNLASHVLDNYKYVYVTTHFLTYGSYFSIMVRFPLDLPILRREHFNRWYASLPYYLALTIADAPVLMSFALIFNVMTYTMTGQPMEQHRIVLLINISIILCFTAQSFGLFAGSMFKLANTLVVAALLMVVHVMFAGVLIMQKDALPAMQWIFEFIFLKYANDAITQALFGYDRERFECDEMYCHFRDPQVFLKMIEVPENTMRTYYNFPIIMFVVHIFTYYNMNKRLRKTN